MTNALTNVYDLPGCTHNLSPVAIILVCTELPLALPEREYSERTLIDPALALARALVRAADPERLKPW